MKVKTQMCRWIIIIVFLLLTNVLRAQPSGGPYGPIQQFYDIPAKAATIYYVSPDGNDTATGSSVDLPTTIESAIQRVKTGDAIILRGGVYRTGNLVFNQGITLQPYRDEQPVFKGTKIADEWERLRGRLWRIKSDTLFPLAPQSWWVKKNNLRSTPVYMFNNDMVFIDGKPLATKGYPAELDENSFCVDYDEGYIYIGADPTNHTIEITAYDSALTRTTKKVHGKLSDQIGPVIKGIIFTQYAYRAIEIQGYDPDGISPESEHGNDVVGTVLEHCTLSHCSRVGAYLRGSKMIVRHNLVSDTATEGLFILSSNDVLIEKNIVTRNNEENIRGYFPSAIKIFNQCYRVTCDDNLIIDNRNASSGIWYDVGNVDGVVINNWVENTENGFFIEISKGAICAGNVFVNCNTGTKVLNSSDAKIYQNTYINSKATFDRSNRGAQTDHFGWHPQTGPGVKERLGHEFGNNLIVVDPSFRLTLFEVQQRNMLCDPIEDTMFDYSDYNVYVRGVATGRPRHKTVDRPRADTDADTPVWRRHVIGRYLMSWTPMETDGSGCTQRFKTLEEFQVLKLGFESNSIYLDDYNGPLFQGKWLGNYTPTRQFANQVKVGPLPENVRKALGDEYKTVDFPGAYLPVQAGNINLKVDPTCSKAQIYH
jgi:hypothetical protein